jgi:uracil-DNA glycosylase family 4
MAFQSLFDVPVEDIVKPVKPKKNGAPPKPRKGSLDPEKRGCKFCPLNKVPGIRKIKGEITGKGILVIAQSPGPKENDEGRELLGPAGEFFWTEMKRVGLRRKDVDVFNVVKCFPADWSEGSYTSYLKMRNPTKEEVHCCSIYSEEHLAKSPAKQILILGQVAAKEFLKVRSLPPQKTFWHEELGVRIYLIDHPAFFIRGYGKGPRMDAFRQTLQRIANDAQGIENTDKNLSDQFAYVHQQDYRLVTTAKQAVDAARIIHKYSAHGYRVTVDIEDDEFDDVDWVCKDCGTVASSNQREYSKDCSCGGQWASKPGRRVIGVGICPKPGLSFFFVLKHPELEGVDLDPVRRVVTELLQDPDIDKAMHYGCTDTTKLLEVEGIIVRGFSHDTNLSEYLRFSDKKQYGLDIIGEQRFPEFSGWKLMVVPEMMKAYGEKLIQEGATKLPAVFNGSLDAQAKFISNKKQYHLKYCSLETLRLYNGGDCDVTKRIEKTNKKHVPQALMDLYIDLSFVLQSMEPRGPLFDFNQHDKLAIIYPQLTKKLKRQLRKLIGNKEYNPGSSQQCYQAIYTKLELEYPFDGKPDTRKMTLLMLGREHDFPKVQLEWRSASKVEGILAGYHRCASAWGGRLRTKWWSTGARTGRLSSGGEKNKKESTIINLQNIKRDPQIRNLCVADKDWRRVYRAINKLVAKCPETQQYWVAVAKAKKAKANVPVQPVVVDEQIRWLARKIEKWIRKFMPDLRTYLILDYGQVEVRVAAQMSGDKNLIADCLKSDIHTTVGTVMTGWDAERIRHDEATRTLTKNCIAEGQRVLTDRGLISIEKVTKSMLVWDGVEFVSHDGVICQGERYVITHDGVTATPDHNVWLSNGEKVTFEEAKCKGARLAITGIEDCPVRYTYDSIKAYSSYKGERVSSIVGTMFGVCPTSGDSRRQYSQSFNNYVCVSEGKKVPRSQSACITREVLGNTATLRESGKSELGQLRWSGYPELLYVGSGFRELHVAGGTPSDIQRCRDRQEEQQWPLQTGKYPVTNKTWQCTKQKKQRLRRVQRSPDGSYSGCGQTTSRLSENYPQSNCTPSSVMCRHSVAGVNQSEGQGPVQASGVHQAVQKSKVYDIINAGPRHRFTVEGKLVSNCHFGILFGISKKNLYSFVLAMSPSDMQGRITEEQVGEAYNNYFARYPGIAEFIRKQRDFAKEHGYVETMFGMIQTLNVTEESEDDEQQDILNFDEMNGGRHAYWGNQAINGPVQGTAHQLMICAIVNLRRQLAKYAILGIPPMEVHDALYFRVRVLDLYEAHKKAKYLLEQESLNTVRKDFPDIDWKVPIVVEAKAGLRLGAAVNVNEKTSIGGFMIDWWKKTKDQIEDLDRQLAEASA